MEEQKVQALTKKYLVTVCNLDFIIQKTMKTVVRRMNECLVKYVAEIENVSFFSFLIMVLVF